MEGLKLLRVRSVLIVLNLLHDLLNNFFSVFQSLRDVSRKGTRKENKA